MLLVFVRRIRKDFNEYIQAVKCSTENLTEALFNFDVTTNNPKPFSTRPKVHYLHHLHEDIRRFGCALHFETEKGEMFNKFIPEQLFHTNRHNPSRDVALRLKKQQLLKHVVVGGSWINSKSKRVRYGSKIEKFFLSESSLDFKDKLLGRRDYEENSDTLISSTTKSGHPGVFKDTESNRVIIGIVADDGNTIKVYRPKEVASLEGYLLYEETGEHIALQGSIRYESKRRSAIHSLY